VALLFMEAIGPNAERLALDPGWREHLQVVS
jgi:hypothetical protein